MVLKHSRRGERLLRGYIASGDELFKASISLNKGLHARSRHELRQVYVLRAGWWHHEQRALEHVGTWRVLLGTGRFGVSALDFSDNACDPVRQVIAAWGEVEQESPDLVDLRVRWIVVA